MPIYEYSCASCGHDFETIHKVSEPAPPCPECGGGVEKRISLAAFHLKGSGWYADAYSGKDNKKPGASDGAAPGAASKGDSAPAADASKPAKAESAPAASPAPTAAPAGPASK
jgi:putative FmdB family regulatory protein